MEGQRRRHRRPAAHGEVVPGFPAALGWRWLLVVVLVGATVSAVALLPIAVAGMRGTEDEALTALTRFHRESTGSAFTVLAVITPILGGVWATQAVAVRAEQAPARLAAAHQRFTAAGAFFVVAGSYATVAVFLDTVGCGCGGARAVLATILLVVLLAAVVSLLGIPLGDARAQLSSAEYVLARYRQRQRNLEAREVRPPWAAWISLFTAFLVVFAAVPVAFAALMEAGGYGPRTAAVFGASLLVPAVASGFAAVVIWATRVDRRTTTERVGIAVVLVMATAGWWMLGALALFAGLSRGVASFVIGGLMLVFVGLACSAAAFPSRHLLWVSAGSALAGVLAPFLDRAILARARSVDLLRWRIAESDRAAAAPAAPRARLFTWRKMPWGER